MFALLCDLLFYLGLRKGYAVITFAIPSKTYKRWLFSGTDGIRYFIQFSRKNDAKAFLEAVGGSRRGWY
jgi:hypothetical protein